MKSGTGDDPFSDVVGEGERAEEAADGAADEAAVDAERDTEETDAEEMETEEAQADGTDATASTTTDESRPSAVDGPDLARLGEGDDGIPWVLRRRSVKEDRPNVTQFFLRDETDRAERRFRGAVEERLDTDVYLLDLREAAYVVAMRHPDEVASLLGRWGYDYRD